MCSIPCRSTVVVVLALIIGLGCGVVGSVSAQQTASSTGFIDDTVADLPGVATEDDTAANSHAMGVLNSTEPVADIEVDTDTVPKSVSPGDSFDVTFTVSNTGGADAYSGGIEFSTPAGIEADSIFLTSGLEAGESVVKTVTVDVDDSIEPGEYTITADAAVGQSTDSVEMTISTGQPVADLEVDATTVPESVSPGDSFDVTLTVTNVGDADAYSGGIEFSTPTGIEADSIFLTSGLEAGEHVVKTATVDVDDSIDPDTYTATASATIGESTDSVTIPVNVGQPVADIDVVAGPTPDPVSLGDSFEVEFAVTNTGEGDATSGGIQFDTPQGVSTSNVFLTDGLESGEKTTETVRFAVDESVDPGEYTVTASAMIGESVDSVPVVLEITDEGGLSRFDQDGTGQIEFREVIAVIRAHNEGMLIGGEPVKFRNVLEVISAHNEKTQI